MVKVIPDIQPGNDETTQQSTTNLKLGDGIMDNDLDLEYERLLGEGSYGKVFLVKQQDGQEFAVKEMDLSRCDDIGRDQALRESTILSQLKHTNILKYVESVISDDSLYIITEFCPGGDMDEYLQLVSKCSTRVPESVISEWVVHLGSALKYLHDKRILHRDMKTKNIFLMADLKVKLGDLGIAKCSSPFLIDEHLSVSRQYWVLDLNQSKADTFIGTPSYMSPELFTGKSYNHKTDIWGLGCCAYEMMTLTRAFQGRALWTLIKEIKIGRKLELPDTYSLEIRTLIYKMMSQDPIDRPSAKDIVENDMLLHQQGEARDDIRKLPKPHQKMDNKQNSKTTSVSTGSSGPKSLKGALEQMSQSQEQKFRNSIASVCEKISTLKASNVGATQTGTFVYKGDSDSDGELEAKGTILDGSLIKQFTEQLETLVDNGVVKAVHNAGGKAEDIDSDYCTESSLSNVNHERGLDDKDFDEFDSNLIKQYSATLEDEEDSDEDLESRDTFVKSDQETLSQDMKCLEMTIKYQYKGLKDTFALRPDKKWKKHMDPMNLFKSPVEKHDSYVKKTSEANGTCKSSTSKHLSVSLTDQSSSKRTIDPRLSKTLICNNEPQNSSNASKIKVCHNEQISKNRTSWESHVKHVKQAFVDQKSGNEDITSKQSNVNYIEGMSSHIQHNVTPSASIDDHSQTVRSGGAMDVCLNQESSKSKKKKSNFLKKQSQARKSSETDNASIVSSQDIKLCSKAQAAQVLKDDSDHEYDNALVSAIGKDTLNKVKDIMSIVKDKQEMQAHLAHILGPKMYEEHKSQIMLLWERSS